MEFIIYKMKIFFGSDLLPRLIMRKQEDIGSTNTRYLLYRAIEIHQTFPKSGLSKIFSWYGLEAWLEGDEWRTESKDN